MIENINNMTVNVRLRRRDLIEIISAVSAVSVFCGGKDLRDIQIVLDEALIKLDNKLKDSGGLR